MNSRTNGAQVPFTSSKRAPSAPVNRALDLIFKRHARHDQSVINDAHRGNRLRLVPIEIRPDVGASLAAGLAHEARLKIGEPNVIRPSVRTDRDRVAAVVILTVDKQTVHARRCG
jgi:hypothetical protein